MTLPSSSWPPLWPSVTGSPPSVSPPPSPTMMTFLPRWLARDGTREPWEQMGWMEWAPMLMSFRRQEFISINSFTVHFSGLHFHAMLEQTQSIEETLPTLLLVRLMCALWQTPSAAWVILWIQPIHQPPQKFVLWQRLHLETVSVQMTSEVLLSQTRGDSTQ